MNMSIGDAVYWTGLIAGAVIGVLGLRYLGAAGIFPLADQYPIVPLLGGIVLGVGIGFVAERAYNIARGPSDSDSGHGPKEPPRGPDDRDRLP